MRIKFGLPIIAGVGVLLAMIAIVVGRERPVARPVLFPPAESPYQYAIAGDGTVEASTDNINIGTPFSEIVSNLPIKVGDVVAKGTLLFKLDTRTYEAALLQSMMQKEQAIVEYENRASELSLYDALTDKRAVSVNSYNQAFYAKQSAKVAIEQAEASIAFSKSYIDRSHIKAPCDGKVLQVNIRVGEIANQNPFTTANLIVFGPTCPYHLRVNIDEDDAWRFQPNTKAIAFVRGNSSIHYNLKYVRTEPLMVPKQALTGSSNERVDTRVLVVIYEFDCDAPHIYAGQILDVFIESISATTRY